MKGKEMEISFRQILVTFGGGSLAAFWAWMGYLVYEQGGLTEHLRHAEWFELPWVIMTMFVAIAVGSGVINLLARAWISNPTIKIPRPTRKRDKDSIPTARVI